MQEISVFDYTKDDIDKIIADKQDKISTYPEAVAYLVRMYLERMGYNEMQTEHDKVQAK